MIDLYYCPTPNCQKVSIALEELGLPYQVHPIDIVAGEQNQPDFAAISPNRKVPAIVIRRAREGARLRFGNRRRYSCIWRRKLTICGLVIRWNRH